MFTWICPKCGGEVPPSLNECPRCTGQATAALPVLPVAAPVVQAPAPLTPPAPVQEALPSHEPAVRVHKLNPLVVALGAAVAIVALLAVLYLWVIPRKTTATSAAVPAPLQDAGKAAVPASAHPLAKHLELVGLRVVEGTPGAVKIQFLVVNHSAADLPDMKMEVELRAADKELFAFPITLPSIGPYEYRELSTTVKTDLKPYELPDWQMLRPTFRLEGGL